jgi:hypothetical protein
VRAHRDEVDPVVGGVLDDLLVGFTPSHRGLDDESGVTGALGDRLDGGLALLLHGGVHPVEAGFGGVQRLDGVQRVHRRPVRLREFDGVGDRPLDGGTAVGRHQDVVVHVSREGASGVNSPRSVVVRQGGAAVLEFRAEHVRRRRGPLDGRTRPGPSPEPSAVTPSAAVDGPVSVSASLVSRRRTGRRHELDGSAPREARGRTGRPRTEAMGDGAAPDGAAPARHDTAALSRATRTTAALPLMRSRPAA